MMSLRSRVAITTAFLFALPALGNWALHAQAKGPVVATIDMAKVLRNFEAVKKAVAYIKDKKDEYQKVIDADQDKIRELNNQIQQDKEKGRDTKDKESGKRKMIFDLQQKYQGLRDKLDRLEGEEFDQIKDRIRAQVEKMAQAKGVDLVIEKQWLYHGAAMDLTEDLLASLGSAAPAGKGKKPARAAEGE
ncbi:MAG: OmpH family outer membrane protein [Candidatus Riflebacteria bacterium]|nr:OmpH family outer membrane protein [Candidatus Riflebacteria bacterium]